MVPLLPFFIVVDHCLGPMAGSMLPRLDSLLIVTARESADH
jgi:hypothetical protein